MGSAPNFFTAGLHSPRATTQDLALRREVCQARAAKGGI